MSELPKRKSMRLKDYDYSQNGAFFVTICVKDSHELLGTVVGAIHNRPQMVLSEYGKIVESSINQIPSYSGTCVEKYIIMPNHVQETRAITNRPYKYLRHHPANETPCF